MARARELGLADEPGWHALVHYHPRRLRPGVVSLADDPAFFFSPDGVDAPEAELEATLRALARPADPVASADGDLHAQCRFPARKRWLAARLGSSAAGFPEVACPEYEAWRSAFDARNLTLVFPEAFLNNPASMFGHTLLRVDATDQPEERDLLAWAINFAAYTDGEGGPLYVLKGLAGRYPGYFSVAPYYEKVKEYGDWENRDLWEYPLDFSRDEIDQVLAHLWELDRIRFDYWFFDENCSFQLLDLLEVGRPGMDLVRGDPMWMIPADSARAVVDRAGLAGEPRFRPSAATRLRHAAASLAPSLQELALAVASGELAPDAPEIADLDDPESAAVLSLAYDYLRYRLLTRRIDPDRSRELARRLLVARSRVGVVGEPWSAPATPAVRPDEGHDTARFAFSTGYSEDRSYLEWRIRPAFHSLLDPEGGYVPGAQIEFLDVAVRVYPEQRQFRLHEIVLIDVTSLSPRDRFFRPLSWRFDIGARTRIVPENGDRDDLERTLVGRVRGGVGLSKRFDGFGLGYVFSEAVFDVGPELERNFALGPSLQAGWLASLPGDRWRVRAFGRATPFLAGARTLAIEAGLAQRLRIGARWSLELRTAWERRFSDDGLEAELRWNLFF